MCVCDSEEEIHPFMGINGRLHSCIDFMLLTAVIPSLIDTEIHINLLKSQHQRQFMTSFT